MSTCTCIFQGTNVPSPHYEITICSEEGRDTLHFNCDRLFSLTAPVDKHSCKAGICFSYIWKSGLTYQVSLLNLKSLQFIHSFINAIKSLSAEGTDFDVHPGWNVSVMVRRMAIHHTRRICRVAPATICSITLLYTWCYIRFTIYSFCVDIVTKKL